MPRHKTGDHTLCEPARLKCASTCHKSQYIQTFTGEMPRHKTGHHTLRAPAQSKCTSTCHKSQYIHLQEKCRAIRPGTTLCASLQNRRAPQHVTRARLHRHLQEKCSAIRPGTTLCASLQNRRAPQHVTSTQTFTREMPNHKTGDHTLCEPARLKCASKCHKS